MRLNSAVLERITTHNFSEPFLKGITESVFLAHQRGYYNGREEHADWEAENIQGINVRAYLEGLLRTTAERHGVDCETIKHPGQRWYHVEIRSGQMVLTAATVASPGAMIEPADYKRGLAESNPDQFQLEGLGSEDMRDDKPLYGIVTHSKYRPQDDQNMHLPGSAILVYPAADLTEYVHTVNLIDRYPDVVKKYVPAEWTEEAVQHYLHQTRKSAVA